MLVFNAVYLRKNKQCSCVPTSFIIKLMFVPTSMNPLLTLIYMDIFHKYSTVFICILRLVWIYMYMLA